MEKIVDFSRQGTADARDGFEVGETGARYGTRRAKMLQEGAFPGRANAGDLVERVGAERFRPLLAMRADRKAVGFVAEPLQVVEHGAFWIEAERLAVLHVEVLAARIAVGSFCDADNEHVFDPQILEHALSHRQLPGTA